MIIPELAETCLKIGVAALIVVVFLYLYINNAKDDSKQLKDANEKITEINTKIFDLFTNEIKNIASDTNENKKLNKDISVILAQTSKRLTDHDEGNRAMWDKQLTAMDKLCESLNGGNPKIVELQKKIEEIKKEIKDR